MKTLQHKNCVACGREIQWYGSGNKNDPPDACIICRREDRLMPPMPPMPGPLRRQRANTMCRASCGDDNDDAENSLICKRCQRMVAKISKIFYDKKIKAIKQILLEDPDNNMNTKDIPDLITSYLIENSNGSFSAGAGSSKFSSSPSNRRHNR